MILLPVKIAREIVSAYSVRCLLKSRVREEIDKAPDARTSSGAKENPRIDRELAITAGNKTLAPTLSACIVRALSYPPPLESEFEMFFFLPV